jgi:hypothetical protein
MGKGFRRSGIGHFCSKIVCHFSDGLAAAAISSYYPAHRLKQRILLKWRALPGWCPFVSGCISCSLFRITEKSLIKSVNSMRRSSPRRAEIFTPSPPSMIGSGKQEMLSFVELDGHEGDRLPCRCPMPPKSWPDALIKISSHDVSCTFGLNRATSLVNGRLQLKSPISSCQFNLLSGCEIIIRIEFCKRWATSVTTFLAQSLQKRLILERPGAA